MDDSREALESARQAKETAEAKRDELQPMFTRFEKYIEANRIFESILKTMRVKHANGD